MFNFITYMRQVAISLKELQHTTQDKHFHRVGSLADLEEFLSNLRIIQGYQLVALDKISGRLDDSSHSDNLLDKRVYTFYLFTQVNYGDFDTHETAIEACLTVTRKIISKMFADKTAGANGLSLLNRSSIYYDTIGPFATGWYGVMCNFSLSDSAGIIYNASDWI